MLLKEEIDSSNLERGKSNNTVSLFNAFQPSVAFHIETSNLICSSVI